MLVSFVYNIVPYQETTTLQLCRTAAAVGNVIYVRSQITDSRQHAESAMLQSCRTAAAVGNTIYVRVACPRYAAASCLCRSLSQFVTPPYHTFLLCWRSGCACPSMRKHRDLCNSTTLDTNPSLHIYVHRGSSLTTFLLLFLRRSQMTDSRQHTESKTLQVGPCARAVSSLYVGELHCHSLSRVILLLIVLNTCRIPRHTCPFSLPGGP